MGTRFIDLGLLVYLLLLTSASVIHLGVSMKIRHCCATSITVVMSFVYAGSTLLTTVGAPRARQGNEPSKPDSLRLKAKMAGGRYTGREQVVFSAVYKDLKQLSRDSIVVVTGVPVRNYGRLSADETTIRTYYRVRVDQVFKGNVEPKQIVTLAVPGGRVTFDDKSFAEIIPVGGLRRLLNDHLYALFLKSTTEEPGVYELTGGPQGAFRLPSSNEGVEPADLRKSDPLAASHWGRNVSQFLYDVQRSVK